MSNKIKTVIFPVGGLGTRFLPATKAMPKEMLPIASKPLIQYVFEEAREAGIENFIFVTGRNKNTIENHFDHAFELQKVLDEKNKEDALYKAKGWLPDAGHIAFVRQQQPLGLGHAIYCARNFVKDGPFAVILPDDILLNVGKSFFKEMIEFYEEVGDNSNIIGLYDVKKENVHKYGAVKIGKDDGKKLEILDMIEKPKAEDAPSNTVIVGPYILQPEIFNFLAKGKRGSGNEIQITDAMTDMLKEGGNPFYGLRFQGERFDCGSILGYLDANIAFALKKPEIKNEVVEIIKKYANKLA